MHSNVAQQLTEFFDFVIVGIIIALIFDFFRAYRKYKKVSNKSVVVQDIVFFLIVSIIIVFSIVYILDSNIRLFIFIAIFLGILIYISIFSKYFLKIYDIIIKLFFDTISFVFLPIKLNLQIISSTFKIFKKYIKKCCKMFFYMVFFLCSKFNFNLFSRIKVFFNKRGLFKMGVKSSKNRRGKMRISLLIPILFIGYCAYTLFDQQIQLNKYNSQISMYEKEIESKNELISYYNEQKNNVNSDEYIEEVARESLGLVKPYEKIFIDANK